ncbi:DUF1294 domain-containing protein [Ramlibacter rhizophilus]|uniref:DUF1294 domain-containing protein n=1 Tax=Ramlibacter rhizophilus TaxID=1781167 RepID=A0A4Z0BYQ3_9BURK|nr:cold shock and DUF1294 domain-containing protein [Ramlibacter rhizophilus]TFZ03428.1 DUF1294 domain-containing protein [Ramlibacter rhizophilus]
MRKEGTIIRWDDAKGFGFIRSPAIAQDVFVHVRDYRASGDEAPRQGLRVTFEDILVGGKGPRAIAVRPAAEAFASKAGRELTRPAASTRKRAASSPAPDRRRADAWWVLPLMLGYGMALTWLVSQRLLPSWVLPASILLNLAAFAAYWRDKYAARTGRWRMREDTLHLWSLAGGWVGAWFAQQVLRHKSFKASFRTAYWFTVMTHFAAAAGISWILRST